MSKSRIIRHATPADLPVMHRIFDDGRRKMYASGNLKQWTLDYPSDALLLGDMKRGFSYIVEEDGQPVATFVLALGEDPTYRKIYEGQWIDDQKPYGTIHRIASIEGVHGVAKYVFEWCMQQTGNLRIDTHRDNLPMQHIVLTQGFRYCGIIYLEDGDERLAYQKV